MGSISQPKEPPHGFGGESWGAVRDISVERRGVEGAAGIERKGEATLGGKTFRCSSIPCEAL